MQHCGTKEIKTKRLLLRQIHLSDAEMMFNNWTNDDEVSRYMRWPTHKSIEETKAVIQNWFNRYSDLNCYHWGICLENGEMIGSIGIMIKDEWDYRAEVGYSIGRKWWGNGYTSEALEAVIKYMFTNTDIERIEGYHSVNNPVSGRVMAKAGMQHEGFSKHKYRNRDGFQDCELYGIIRTDLIL